MRGGSGRITPCEPAWWEDEAALQRFVCDLAAAELRALRPSAPACYTLAQDPSLQIGTALGADSLELLALAGALAEAVHLHESGIEDALLAHTAVGDWTAIVRTGLQRYCAALTFRTSGSTGQPKRCTHTLSALWQEATQLASLFEGRCRILSAVPSHHIYGFLFNVLLPRALGLAGQPVVDLRVGSPARLAHQLRDGDLVVAHPEYWKLAARAVPAIPPGVIGVSSSAPCPDALAAALADAGLSRLVQVYGSSETAGVGWREHHDNPYRLFPYWRHGIAGMNTLLRTMPDGALTRFECQDRLMWLDGERFVPLGRRDAAVQVGGINVYPARVRDVLLRHPEVRDAAVRPMRPEEGSRLKAFVVARDPAVDPMALHARLEQWVAAELAAPERPKAFSFGPALPLSENGKPADWPLLPAASSAFPALSGLDAGPAEDYSIGS